MRKIIDTIKNIVFREPFTVSFSIIYLLIIFEYSNLFWLKSQSLSYKIIISIIFSIFFTIIISRIRKIIVLKYKFKERNYSYPEYLSSEIKRLKKLYDSEKTGNEKVKSKIEQLKKQLNDLQTKQQEFSAKLQGVEKELKGGSAKNTKLLRTEWVIVGFLILLSLVALFALFVLGSQEYIDYQKQRDAVDKTYQNQIKSVVITEKENNNHLTPLAEPSKNNLQQFHIQGHVFTVFCFVVFIILINTLNRRLKEINQHNQQSRNIDEKIAVLRAINAFSEDEQKKENAVNEFLDNLLKKEDMAIENKEEIKEEEGKTFLEKIIEKVLNSKYM